ncbi:GYF domain-containing protein [Stenotrophomonas sp. AB1(2024)]|uniref:GYF domain-containing protein n=1 Tax=Stenotrophomonas sp. AB1(2024) TaxID=3132215 RepID=UPI0030A8BD3B
MSQWFYAEGNRQQRGPLTSEELIALYQSSRIALDTLVWRDGLAQWQPLRSVADEVGLVVAPPPTVDATLDGPPPAEPVAPTPPRLPGFDTPAPRPAAATPPPKRTSGCLIIGLVVGLVMVVIVAILAAIALPAYQDYVNRARLASAVGTLSPLKNQVAEFVHVHDRCPVNSDDGFHAPGAYATEGVGAVRIGRFGEGRCGVEIEFSMPGKRALDGRMLWYEYDTASQEWSCSSDADSKYVPAQCRR